MKDGLVDLHIHTTASSDGQHTPTEIFEMAKARDLKAIAFADHNSVGSIDEGLELSKVYNIELVPCFELNTVYDEMDIHLLAYFIEYREPAFHVWLEEIQEAKNEQALGRLRALQELGFPINRENLEKAAKGQIPSGSTFMKALLSTQEGRHDSRLSPYIYGDRSDSPSLNFYRDYFRKGKPAFVPLEVCTTEEGIKKIKQFGGVPVQAHPSDTGDERIRKLKDAGLMGLEAYSSYHSPEENRHFKELARICGIIATSGSDFHGKRIKPNVEMASVGGNSYDIVERLRDAKKKL